LFAPYPSGIQLLGTLAERIDQRIRRLIE